MSNVEVTFVVLGMLFGLMAMGLPIFITLGVSSLVGIVLHQGVGGLSAVTGVM